MLPAGAHGLDSQADPRRRGAGQGPPLRRRPRAPQDGAVRRALAESQRAVQRAHSRVRLALLPLRPGRPLHGVSRLLPGLPRPGGSLQRLLRSQGVDVPAVQVWSGALHTLHRRCWQDRGGRHAAAPQGGGRARGLQRAGARQGALAEGRAAGGAPLEAEGGRGGRRGQGAPHQRGDSPGPPGRPLFGVVLAVHVSSAHRHGVRRQQQPDGPQFRGVGQREAPPAPPVPRGCLLSRDQGPAHRQTGPPAAGEGQDDTEDLLREGRRQDSLGGGGVPQEVQDRAGRALASGDTHQAGPRLAGRHPEGRVQVRPETGGRDHRAVLANLPGGAGELHRRPEATP
mmetsp:Transcript_38877/g.121471  ORF Transcript_38877/g.121471 Transcript_38877/m.121471 type:complete len:341 (+) Transcript_38877:284-1306(+)